MVDEVGSLRYHGSIVLHGKGQGQFHTFLPYLLCTSLKGAVQQLSGIGAGTSLTSATLNGGLQGSQEACQAARPEAGRGARMARWASRDGLDEECIGIAVGMHSGNAQRVATGLAFGPKALPGPAPERHESVLLRPLNGFGIHHSEHQYDASSGILDDGGKQSGCIIA
jgi:hypothetical protein